MIFEQRLSSIEAQHIKSTPNGKFRFDGLIITVSNPNNFPIIEPQQVEIERDLETTLDKITYKETEGMKRLKDEIESLKQQKEELEAHVQKRGLKFEIDTKQTQVQYRGYSDNGNSITLAAVVRLRCIKEVDSKLAIKEFRARLHSEGDEAVFGDGTLVRAYVDNETRESVNIEAGWTIDEPLTEFRFYEFVFDVGKQPLRRDLFVRITMNAIGQESQHIDFFVDSWQDAVKALSGISLRRVVQAHHESA